MTNQDTSAQHNPRKMVGTVVSDKMQDTVVVEVQSFDQHPKYRKYSKSSKKYSVHDKGNTAKLGDKVTIVETKPISKTKRFTLLQD